MKKRLLLSALVSLAFALGIAACSKKLPGEPDAVYKKRAAAILTAQSVTGIEALSDATDVLVNAGKVGKPKGKAIVELDIKLAESWKIVKDRLQNGVQCAPLPGQDASKSVCTIDLIAALADDLRAAEERGVFAIDDPELNRRFQVFVLGAKTSLLALKGFFRNKSDLGAAASVAELKASENRLRAQQSDPQWVFDLFNLAIVAGQRIQYQSSLLTAEAAFADGDELYLRLKQKNADRLTAYIN